jgi:hypothetical protein
MAVEKTSAFLAATYSGGATLALWGVIEIFLRIDPFIAVCFKHLLIIGVAFLGVGLGGVLARWVFPSRAFPKRLRRISANGLIVATILGILLLIPLFFAPVYAEACSDSVGPLTITTLALTPAIAILVTYVATAAIMRVHQDRALAASLQVAVARQRAIARSEEFVEPADRPRGKFPAWFDIPLIVPIFVIGLFFVSISLGRSEQIQRVDVAQEELRQAGLTLSMESLQNAIYFNPRAVELFIEAGVTWESIVRALRADTDLNPGTALLSVVMEGISDLEGDCTGANAAECQRTADFLAMFEQEQTGRAIPEMVSRALSRRVGDGRSGLARDLDCGKVLAPITLDDDVRDGTPPRAIISHAFMGSHTEIASALIRECGWTSPLADVRSTTGHLRDDLSPAEVLERQRFHVLATLDPHLALIDAVERGVADRAQAERLADALCRDRDDDPDARPVKATGLLGFRDADWLPEDCGAELEATESVTVDMLDLTLDPASGCSAQVRSVERTALPGYLAARLPQGNGTAIGALETYSLAADGFAAVVHRHEGRTRILMREVVQDGPRDQVSALGWDLEAPGHGMWFASDFTQGATRDGPGAKRTVYVVTDELAPWETPTEVQLLRPTDETPVMGEEKEPERFGQVDPGAPALMGDRFNMRNPDMTPVFRQSVALDEPMSLRTRESGVEGCLIIARQDRETGEASPSLAIAIGGMADDLRSSPLLPAGSYMVTAVALEGSEPLAQVAVETFESLPCIARSNVPEALETGDDFFQATRVEPGAAPYRCAFDVSEPMELEVTAGTADGNVDLTLELFEGEGGGQSLARVDSGEPEVLRSVLEPGRYRFVVAPWAAETFETSADLDLSLRTFEILGQDDDLSTCAPVDAAKVDAVARLRSSATTVLDDLGEAHKVVIGRESRQHMTGSPASGLACGFDLSEAARVRVQAAAQQDIVVQIYGADGTPILQDGDDDVEDMTQEQFDVPLDPGTYLFVISPYDEDERLFVNGLTVTIGARGL